MIQAQDNKVTQTQWQFNELMPMSDAEYTLWLSLLEERTGITLPETRKSFLLSKLSIRMQELGINAYKSYFAYVTHGKAGRVEWEILVDRLTIHETRFFVTLEPWNSLNRLTLINLTLKIITPTFIFGVLAAQQVKNLIV